MMVYRIARRPYIDLSGAGGLYAAGRWHHQGAPIIYASANLETALLEIAVHNYLSTMRKLGVVLTINIPKDSVCSVQESGLLPEGFTLDDVWRRQPDLVAITRTIGSNFLRQKEHLVLAVPSIVVDSSTAINYLINPLHDRMREVSYEASDLMIDPRLKV